MCNGNRSSMQEQFDVLDVETRNKCSKVQAELDCVLDRLNFMWR
mgnify:CR=1 FL=1